MLFHTYLALATISAPLWKIVLQQRIKSGKEDPSRVQEKLGYFRLQRPDGLLLWFHALSVGESLALLTLLKRLGELYPSAHFLLTTNTKTSVEALTSVGLPERVIHSYLPADARGPVQRFLNHWKPDILAITETDLWPYMITQASRRGIPLVLINGRVANTSFRRRMKTRNIYYNILPMFQQILAQDKVDADHLIERPTEMATDQAGKVPAIAHALQAAEAAFGQKADILVDLGAISPLRDLSDITGAIDLLRSSGAPNVITGMTSRHSPYFNMVEHAADGALHISKKLPSMVLRRQHSPACFDMNGSVYVWLRDRFMDDPQVFYPYMQLFEMPEERSVDIDSPLDFKFVEMLLIQKDSG